MQLAGLRDTLPAVPERAIPTRVVVEAKRTLSEGAGDRVALAAARRLASGGTVDDEFVQRAAGHVPGPITARWLGLPNPQPQVEGKTAVDYSDGIMIALMIPESLANTIAVPDGQPADELHITLAYLGSTEEVDDDSDFLVRLLQAVRDVAADSKTLSGMLSGTGRFVGDPKDVYYASADVPGLEDLHHELIEALGEAEIDVDREHGFTPHVTLSYLPTNAELPQKTWTPRPVSFEDVSVVYGANVIPVRLGGAADEEESAVATRSDPLPTTTSATVNADNTKMYDPQERARRRAEARGGAR